jgi:hypothetical protein
MRSTRSIAGTILGAILALGACTGGSAGSDAGSSKDGHSSFSNATTITNTFLPLSQGGR